MVPEVDKQDTEQALRGLRTTVESVRQEILSWTLDKTLTAHDAEAHALRKLAARSAQQTRQWTGRMLAELGSQYPYPNSSDASTQIIDKTTVPITDGLSLPAEYTVVQKIKHTRATLSQIKGQLEDLLRGCIPGSFFNQCLFEVQKNAIQTSMWLGELLAEFVIVPQVETPVPGNDAAPTLNTTPESPTESSNLGAESSLVPNSTDVVSPESEVPATSALTPSPFAGNPSPIIDELLAHKQADGLAAGDPAAVSTPAAEAGYPAVDSTDSPIATEDPQATYQVGQALETNKKGKSAGRAVNK